MKPPRIYSIEKLDSDFHEPEFYRPEIRPPVRDIVWSPWLALAILSGIGLLSILLAILLVWWEMPR